MTQPIIIKEFQGKTFYFYETPQAGELINEIFSDNYKIFEREIEIRPGDAIIDIGACEGMFSIMMAKLNPKATVIAVEPVSRAFYQMMRNIGLNGVMNVVPVNGGVGKERGKIKMAIGKDNWNGGSSGVMTFNPANHEMTEVEIMSLDSIFTKYDISRCRLMKIDIEGMEYEALYNSTCLGKVDYFTAEFHINGKLVSQGRDMSELATWVGEKTNLIYFERCHMAE